MRLPCDIGASDFVQRAGNAPKSVAHGPFGWYGARPIGTDVLIGEVYTTGATHDHSGCVGAPHSREGRA